MYGWLVDSGLAIAEIGGHTIDDGTIVIGGCVMARFDRTNRKYFLGDDFPMGNHTHWQ